MIGVVVNRIFFFFFVQQKIYFSYLYIRGASFEAEIVSNLTIAKNSQEHKHTQHMHSDDEKSEKRINCGLLAEMFMQF